MKIWSLVVIIAALTQSVCFSQTADLKTTKELSLSPLLGYGPENNWGNRAIFAGVVIGKQLKKHLSAEIGLTYFTTAVPDQGRDMREGYKGLARKYNALFFTPAVSYTFGNHKSQFNLSFKTGPSLKYFDYKSYRSGLFKVGSDGQQEPILESIRYWEEQGLNVSLYNSINIDAKVTKALRIGLFLDVYSGLIPIEHFMPGINASFQLKRK